MWERVKKISFISIIGSSLLINGLTPLAMYAQGRIEAQTPSEELQTIIQQEEKEMKQIQTKEQTEVEQERTKLTVAEAALAKALQEADQLMPQLVQQTYKEAQKGDQAAVVQFLTATQLLQQARKGHLLPAAKIRTISDRTVMGKQAKKVLTAIREAQTQIKASPQQIKELVTNDEQQIVRVQQEKKQHETKQQRLQTQALKVDVLKEALEALVHSITMDCEQVTKSTDDERNKMVAIIRVVANANYLKEILANVEANKEKLPAAWREEWVKSIAPSLQEKQALISQKITTMLKERIAKQVPGAEQLLNVFQQNNKKQLEQVENQFVAAREQADQEKVVAMRAKLQQAHAREEAAYEQVGQQARKQVEQERLMGEVKLLDLWASQREEGAERTAAQIRAAGQTKDMMEVLKRRDGCSFQALWQALNQNEKKQAWEKTSLASGEMKTVTPLYTTAEQATHYGIIAIEVGKQLQLIVQAVQGEHERKIASEATFGKMFTKLGESFQHSGQLFQLMYEGNKQTIQAVEKELQTSLFGPEEQETDTHIRQQRNKQQVLRILAYLGQLLEQVNTAIAVSDLVVQAQWITALKQPFQTETQQATYVRNIAVAAEYVLQVKQAQMQVREQYEALKQGFIPTVEQIEHNLFDAPGWQAQVIDKLKYIQFVFIGIDPIGSFVPIDPEVATMVGVKGISRRTGIISRANRKLDGVKKSAGEIEGKTGTQVGKKVEKETVAESKTEIKACRPCKIGGRAKRSLEQCCELEPQAGTSTAPEQGAAEEAIEQNVPAAPTAEEIATMTGQAAGAGSSGEIKVAELEKSVPAAPTADEIVAMKGQEVVAESSSGIKAAELEKGVPAAPTADEIVAMKGQEVVAESSSGIKVAELEKGIPATPTAAEIAAMKGQEVVAESSSGIKVAELEKGIPATPTAAGIAAMKGQEVVAESSSGIKVAELEKSFPTAQTVAEAALQKEEEIVTFPDEQHPLILKAKETRKLIRIPLLNGKSILGKLSFDAQVEPNQCEILITGVTQVDASLMPAIYGIEHYLISTHEGQTISFVQPHTFTGQQHFLRYKNEVGNVLPIERVRISVDSNRSNPVIYHVGQICELQWVYLHPEEEIVTGTVRGKVLSLGDKEDDFIQIGIPAAATNEQIKNLPLNLLVRMDSKEQGIYKPVQYVYTDEAIENEAVTPRPFPDEQKVVVNQSLGYFLTVGNTPLELIVDHIDTFQQHPLVFAHMSVPAELEQEVKDKIEELYPNKHIYSFIEWNGQRIKVPIIIRIGNEVIGGKIENIVDSDDEDAMQADHFEEWISVNHWRPISMEVTNAKNLIKSILVRSDQFVLQLGSTMEILNLFSFNLQTKTLQKLLHQKLVPQAQMEKLQAELKDILINTLLPVFKDNVLQKIATQYPIYDYGDYAIENNRLYIRKQVMEIMKKAIPELLKNDVNIFGFSLSKEIRRKMDPIMKEIIRNSSQHYYDQQKLLTNEV